MFERICKDGNYFLTYDELTPSDVARKMKIIETQPEPIWRAIEKQFGYGFFHKIIEAEFGVTPEFREQIMTAWEKNLTSLRKETEEKICKLQLQSESEIINLKEKLLQVQKKAQVYEQTTQY